MNRSLVLLGIVAVAVACDEGPAELSAPAVPSDLRIVPPPAGPPGAEVPPVLMWTDNSTDETGFEIERDAATTGSFSPLEVVEADTTRYVDWTPMTSGAYCWGCSYRVRAVSSCCSSAWSNTAKADSAPLGPGPDPF